MATAAANVKARASSVASNSDQSLIDASTVKFNKKDRVGGTIKLKRPNPKHIRPGGSDDKRKGVSPSSPSVSSPVINELDEKEKASFTSGRPLTDDPDYSICKHCKKPTLRTVMSSHVAKCIKTKQEKAKKKKEAKEAAAREKDAKERNDSKDKDADTDMMDVDDDGDGDKSKADGKDNDDNKKGKKRKAEAESDKAPKNKKKKEEPKPKVPKPKGPVDVEKQCGVVLANGAQCARSLTCKSHSMGAKRGVRRSLPYDMLLSQYQKKNQAKQQKAAIDANAPLQDEYDGSMPVDSDEEKDLVMAAFARYRPQPLETHFLVSTTAKNRRIRLKQCLDGQSSKIFSSGDWGLKSINTSVQNHSNFMSPRGGTEFPSPLNASGAGTDNQGRPTLTGQAQRKQSAASAA